MAPTSVKTVHHTFLLYIESNLDRLKLLSPTPGQHLQHAPIRFDQQAQVSRGHTSYRNTNNENTVVHGGGGLDLVKPARESAIQPSKALCVPENAQRILPVHRSLLDLFERKQAVVRVQISPKKPPSSHTFGSRAQGFNTPVARRRSSCPPPSPSLVRTRLII